MRLTKKQHLRALALFFPVFPLCLNLCSPFLLLEYSSDIDGAWVSSIGKTVLPHRCRVRFVDSREEQRSAQLRPAIGRVMPTPHKRRNAKIKQQGTVLKRISSFIALISAWHIHHGETIRLSCQVTFKACTKWTTFSRQCSDRPDCSTPAR